MQWHSKGHCNILVIIGTASCACQYNSNADLGLGKLKSDKAV